MRWLLALVLMTGLAQAQVPTPPGAVFQDCTDCPDMVVVPAGEAVIGATPEDLALMVSPESAKLEQPRHKVTLHSFAIGRSAVTRAQFAAFQFETGYEVTGGCNTFDLTANEFVEHPGISWTQPGFTQGDRDPVVCVSYKDAMAYAGWLTRKTRRPYRLPTEAEWEYAARAGTTGLRYWGSEDACRYANVADQATKGAGLEDSQRPVFACNDGRTTPVPIASFQPNRFGLYDVFGNVAQWTADCLHPSYDGAPSDGSIWGGAKDCQRMIRGGGWMAGPNEIRAARRSSNPPEARDNGLGFRVAREIEPPPEADGNR